MNDEKNLKFKETFNLAFQNHKKKNFLLAEELYKKVLIINPKHFETIYLLGSLSVQTKDYNKGKDYYIK